ncbi:M56 family peptidase [Thalassotalea euphylliae]|uniref:M56 family peptidase n=1 Tax=Thalassotalea euphylliae TaxID=1655234 RepID=A0A3E0TXB4_9GAMM|nr:M56 family metallopeptidase [Thalassotalea euphylliae]REL28542.1 M56 family peptidase [Thalassotalea euphylliae]
MILALATSTPELQALTQVLTLTLLHFLWQGLVVAGVLKLALSVIALHRSRVRYGLTCLAMLVNLALPLITFSYFYQPLTNAFAAASNTMPIAQFQHVLQYQHGITWYSQSLDYLPLLSFAWLTCVVFLTCKLLFEVTTTGRLARYDTIATEPKLLARFDELVKQMALPRTPRLVISLKTQVPMAIGWLKPVVLMPAQMLMGLNQTQLEMLLLHELAHIRRHDYLVNFLQALIEILLFFHPAVSWVSKQMRQEREYCTDDMAVAQCGNAVAYAHTLADTASLCQHHRHDSIPAMAMAASGGDLKARVVRLVDHSCTHQPSTGRLLAALVVVSGLFTLGAKQVATLPWFDVTGMEITKYNEHQLSHNAAYFSESPFNESRLQQGSIAGQLLAFPNWSSKMSNRSGEQLHNPSNAALNSDSIALNTIPRYEHTSLAAAINSIDQFSNESSYSRQEFSANDQSEQASIATTNELLKPNVDRWQSSRIQAKELLAAQANTEQNNTAISQSLSPSVAETLTSETENEIALVSVPQNHTTGKFEANVTLDAGPIAKPAAGIAGESYTHSRSSASEYNVLDKIASTGASVHQDLFDVPESKVSLFEQRYQSAPRQQLESIFSTQPAKLMSAIDPRYPSVAKRKGIELDVQVNFTVDEFGRVTNIEFEQQSKLGYFRSAIISAIKQWRFEPALNNGEPVDSKMSKIFSFSMS